MPQRPIFSIAVFSLFCLVGASLSGCVVANRPHGYVYTAPGPVVYDYWYYPDAQVYYNYNSGLYFYLGSGGTWIETRTLPPGLHVRLGSYVPIQSHYQRPYRDYDQHRRAYPPRQREKYREYDRRDDYREPPRQPEKYREYDRRDDYREPPRHQPPPPTWRELNQRQEQERQERGYPPSRDNRNVGEPAYRGEPPRKYPPVKQGEKDHSKDKDKKQSGKDKKSKDKKQKDKKDNRNDNPDDKGAQDDNKRREWERRSR